MKSDKMQALANMTTRQKVIAILMIVIVLIILWQLISMFGGSRAPAPVAPVASSATPTMKPSEPGSMPPAAIGTIPSQPGVPKPAEIPQAQPMSEREAELMRLQQETQAKYIQALNELQMLKVAKDIAITSKDISSAKLAKVVSEKKIIDLLAPPPPPSPSDSLIKNIAPVSPMAGLDQEVKYTVISVSQLQYRWGAVLGFKGSLFNVHVGDVLPADGSTVVAIGKDGVTLEKDGVRKKISLVPVI
ncbi:MAG: hypothetical protein KIT56_01930 [Gammaproteobacteria bacterium]|nr:hypothetical protein [Gammaproteobacteria bacterium]MCW5582643.1 hypothetical protein [Gammaproteobacteria bacterium]